MALGPTAHRGGREATDSAPYTYLCTPPPPTIFFSSLPRMRDLRCSRIALCIAPRGSVAVAGMMPAQEEADSSFHECSRESRGRARPRERGNHRRCGLSTEADRSPAPGGGRLRWPAPGGGKVIRIGLGSPLALAVDVPFKAAMLGLEWPEVRRLFDERDAAAGSPKRGRGAISARSEDGGGIGDHHAGPPIAPALPRRVSGPPRF